MSISHICSKIKGIGLDTVRTADRRALYGALVSSLTGILCFFLGRIAYFIETRPPVELKIVDMPKAPAESPRIAITSSVVVEKAFVASKGGKKYYPAGCSGARSIAEGNRVWFATKEEAEKAGYTPSTTCK